MAENIRIADVPATKRHGRGIRAVMTVLGSVAGFFLVLAASYIPTTVVGRNEETRSGAVGIVVFCVILLSGIVVAMWLVARGKRWRAVSAERLQTGGRVGAQATMYWLAASAILAILYGATLASNPKADWRYGIYLIATVLPLLGIAVISLLLIRAGNQWGKLLGTVALICWPLAFIVFGNLLGLGYGLLLTGAGIWSFRRLKPEPA